MPETAASLTDSNDPEVLEARAEVIKWRAKLAKAKQPLIDRLIMRGLIPIALAVVGPWALYTWNEDTVKTQAQVAEVEGVVGELQALLAEAIEARAEREEMTKRNDEARAVELHALATMVSRLGETIRRLTVRTAVREAVRDGVGTAPARVVPMSMDFERARVVEEALIQFQESGIDDQEMDELREIARHAYDQWQEQEQEEELARKREQAQQQPGR